MAPDHMHQPVPLDLSFTHHSHDHHHESDSHSHHHNHAKHNVEPFSIDQSHHDDEHSSKQNQVLRKLKIAAILCFSFLLIELIGGAVAGSLAVLSDAAHMTTDFLGYVVFIMGSHIASAPPSKQYTFGYKRSESLVALLSMVTLAVMSIGLAAEAIRRIWKYIHAPDQIDPIDGKMMVAIASVGVVVNVTLAVVLGENHIHLPGDDHGGHDHSHGHDHHHPDHDGGHSHAHVHYHDEVDDLLVESDTFDENDVIEPIATKPSRNISLNAAYIHALSDLALSIALLIAGLFIWWKPTWQVADPVCTLVFSIIVICSTVGVTKASLSVLMEKVPQGVHWDEIHDAICQVSGVSDVRELHIWSISHDCYILSVHVLALDVDQAFHDIKKICREHNIMKSTVQVRPNVGDELSSRRAIDIV